MSGCALSMHGGLSTDTYYTRKDHGRFSVLVGQNNNNNDNDNDNDNDNNNNNNNNNNNYTVLFISNIQKHFTMQLTM